VAALSNSPQQRREFQRNQRLSPPARVAWLPRSGGIGGGAFAAYGLSDVAILQFPADGKIFYGPRGRGLLGTRSLRSCEIKEVKEAKGVKENDASAKLAAGAEDCKLWAEPIVLAEDSETADVTTE